MEGERGLKEYAEGRGARRGGGCAERCAGRAGGWKVRRGMEDARVGMKCLREGMAGAQGDGRMRGGVECLLGDDGLIAAGDGGCAEGFAQGRLHRPAPPARRDALAAAQGAAPRVGPGREAERGGVGVPEMRAEPLNRSLGAHGPEPPTLQPPPPPGTGAPPGAHASPGPPHPPYAGVLPVQAEDASPAIEASRDPTAPELFPRGRVSSSPCVHH